MGRIGQVTVQSLVASVRSVVACALVILGLEYLYRRTLVGRAFVAIAEDNFAARALGLPERNLRIASYALAGVIGGVAGFSGGDLESRDARRTEPVRRPQDGDLYDGQAGLPSDPGRLADL